MSIYERESIERDYRYNELEKKLRNKKSGAKLSKDEEIELKELKIEIKDFRYSFCKKIFICKVAKEIEKPISKTKRRGTATIKAKIYENDLNLSRVVEDRGYSYEYYKGVRSKLYCEYQEKIHSPVSYTTYEYGGEKYCILTVLNNIYPNENVRSYLRVEGGVE